MVTAELISSVYIRKKIIKFELAIESSLLTPRASSSAGIWVQWVADTHTSNWQQAAARQKAEGTEPSPVLQRGAVLSFLVSTATVEVSQLFPSHSQV